MFRECLVRNGATLRWCIRLRRIRPIKRVDCLGFGRRSGALLLGLSVAQIRERLFTSAAELGERGLTRLPIKTIHINKSPS